MMSLEKKTVLVTGGIGCGKSLVMEMLKNKCGADVILADDVARKLCNSGGKGYALLKEALGERLPMSGSEIDPAAFSRLLFSDEKILLKVNSLIHPLAWAELRHFAGTSKSSLVAVETALPDKRECGFADEIWAVEADEETRINRLMRSRGYSLEKCRSIMSKQLPCAAYRELADRVIDNSSGEHELRDKLILAVKALRGGAV